MEGQVYAVKSLNEYQVAAGMKVDFIKKNNNKKR